MGFLKDLFKDVIDEATGGAISNMEANIAIRQLEQLENDTEKFNKWFQNHCKSYTDLRDALNVSSYQVDRKIFHANFWGKAEWDGKSINEEDEENNRRKKLMEEAIKNQSHDYMKKGFKNYLSETEKSILDSYNFFRIFQNEMTYLPTFQKDIVDSVYLAEIKKLLGSDGREAALTKIKDFAWQIERHKTPAGHAIVLLVLAKQVYHDNSGFAGDIKTRIEDALTRAEDIIIENTCKPYLTEDVGVAEGDILLKTGKDFFINGEPEKAFAYFLSASKKGNTEAQYRTGLCFEKGYGVYENKEKAIYWYKKSAESSNPISKYYLATVYHWLLPESEQNYDKAFELYKTAFDEGVAEAAENIGNMYAEGKGVNKDDAVAVEWYEKGAAAGSPWAMYHLYTAYMDGTGVEANSEMARQWFTKCVNFFGVPKEATEDSCIEEDLGFNECVLNSSLPAEEVTNAMSECGTELADIMENTVSSICLDGAEEATNEFYGNLLSPGCDSIFNSIARVYYKGSSVILKDVDKAVTWFEKGVAIGTANSLDWLEYIYTEKGWHTDAAEYAYRAAKCGNSNSMNRLGLKYYNGKGVDKDKVIANVFFLRAAKNGSEWGQHNVALEFLSGETGLPKDIKEARYWLTLAAEQGNEDSQKKLVELDKQDEEQRKKELKREKMKLKKEKSTLLSKISEIDQKIDEAQSQHEEENLIKEKDVLEKELTTLDRKINEYE